MTTLPASSMGAGQFAGLDQQSTNADLALRRFGQKDAAIRQALGAVAAGSGRRVAVVMAVAGHEPALQESDKERQRAVNNRRGFMRHLRNAVLREARRRRNRSGRSRAAPPAAPAQGRIPSSHGYGQPLSACASSWMSSSPASRSVSSPAMTVAATDTTARLKFLRQRCLELALGMGFDGHLDAAEFQFQLGILDRAAVGIAVEIERYLLAIDDADQFKGFGRCGKTRRGRDQQMRQAPRHGRARHRPRPVGPPERSRRPIPK